MLAAKDIFETLESGKYGTDYQVFVSFYEIYCGQLFDLINKRKRFVLFTGFPYNVVSFY